MPLALLYKYKKIKYQKIPVSVFVRIFLKWIFTVFLFKYKKKYISNLKYLKILKLRRDLIISLSCRIEFLDVILRD